VVVRRDEVEAKPLSATSVLYCISCSELGGDIDPKDNYSHDAYL
jgi:hypothetical protein